MSLIYAENFGLFVRCHWKHEETKKKTKTKILQKKQNKKTSISYREKSKKTRGNITKKKNMKNFRLFFFPLLVLLKKKQGLPIHLIRIYITYNTMTRRA